MFRNKEVFKFTILFLIIAVITVTMGFAISIASGILAIISATAFGTVFFIFTKNRYKAISKISNEIDVVLYDDDKLYIADIEEGELSILQSEINKMIVRIKEQNELLKKEKKHLADSMADIAHQLRTPLTSVNIIMSLLENNSDKNERQSLIHETKELFEQMDWLLNSLLKLSILDAGIVKFKSDDINVNELISMSIHPFLIQMDIHNIALKEDVPKNIHIKGDFGWLLEAIKNIMKNCIESVGDNGKIEIFCNDNPLFTEINIKDNGKGFAKEDLPHLFERFYRSKDSNATGYGIGLALCKMIISYLGGVITAKNHESGGAIFSIRFSK